MQRPGAQVILGVAVAILDLVTFEPFLAGLGAAQMPGFGWIERAPNASTLAVPQATTFKAPEVASAADVVYPLQTTADGIVVFNVSVGRDGGILGTTTLSDIPPLTAAAQSSLQSWKFKPALLNGTRETSQMLVAFVFHHAIKEWNPPPFNPAFPSPERDGYVPAGIYSATYCDYPTSTVAAGATVVQVAVRPDNTLGDVQVVRPLSGGFVPLAVAAAKQWRFQSAVLNGTPVPSKVAIAYVFSSRAMNPF